MFAFRVGERKRFAARDDCRFENQEPILHQLAVGRGREVNLQIKPPGRAVVARIDFAQFRSRSGSGHPAVNCFFVV